MYASGDVLRVYFCVHVCIHVVLSEIWRDVYHIVSHAYYSVFTWSQYEYNILYAPIHVNHYLCVCVCVCVCLYVYTYNRIYTHTHTHMSSVMRAINSHRPSNYYGQKIIIDNWIHPRVRFAFNRETRDRLHSRTSNNIKYVVVRIM
jgi:hypothetical protein